MNCVETSALRVLSLVAATVPEMLAGLPSAAILSCNGASSVENHHLSKRLSLFFFKLVLLF